MFILLFSSYSSDARKQHNLSKNLTPSPSEYVIFMSVVHGTRFMVCSSAEHECYQCTCVHDLQHFVPLKAIIAQRVSLVQPRLSPLPFACYIAAQTTSRFTFPCLSNKQTGTTVGYICTKSRLKSCWFLCREDGQSTALSARSVLCGPQCGSIGGCRTQCDGKEDFRAKAGWFWPAQ